MGIRWFVVAVCGVLCVLAGGASAASPLTVELRGFGYSLGLTAACPSGLTRISIVGTDRSALDCVTRAQKFTKPGLDPWRIVESVRVTTPFVGGAIYSVETQTFTFTRSQASTAVFRGRIVGGTGRYKGMTGTVRGGGKGHNGVAIWHETFQLG
ncbi:MAG TPA: hypothetical protein VEH55_06070 [Gaiellaceae bacterium]|nr:hypothetical protein [Gaiellaceae bacterium]